MDGGLVGYPRIWWMWIGLDVEINGNPDWKIWSGRVGIGHHTFSQFQYGEFAAVAIQYSLNTSACVSMSHR
jgi:hypothetical protein